jgi:hypothetical protein
MALRNEEALQSRRAQPPAVEFVTENGFSIVRLCEIDPSTRDTADECCFVVHNPDGGEHKILVEFDEHLIELIQQRRRRPLSLSSSFWLECAERQLATYLWQSDSCPPEGRLIVSELSSDYLLLANHWID